MTIEALVARYGLAAVFLGSVAEGETVVLAGGLLASRYLLSLPAVIITAACGAFACDQSLFLVGRVCRNFAPVVRQVSKPNARKALDALERHPAGFILTM